MITTLGVVTLFPWYLEIYFFRAFIAGQTFDKGKECLFAEDFVSLWRKRGEVKCLSAKQLWTWHCHLRREAYEWIKLLQSSMENLSRIFKTCETLVTVNYIQHPIISAKYIILYHLSENIYWLHFSLFSGEFPSWFSPVNFSQQHLCTSSFTRLLIDVCKVYSAWIIWLQ